MPRVPRDVSCWVPGRRRGLRPRSAEDDDGGADAPPIQSMQSKPSNELLVASWRRAGQGRP
jgi:hypothetical protein